MRYEIRARSFSEILDAAFQLYRNHVTIFLPVSALVSLPTLAVQLLIVWLRTGKLEFTSEKDLSITLLCLPLNIISYIALQSLLTAAIGDAYLGNAVTVGATFKRIKPYWLSLASAYWLTTTGIVAWSLLFLIPGIIAALCWLFTGQVILFEHSSARAAMRRSYSLTQDRRWELFSLGGVVGGLQWILGMGLVPMLPAVVLHMPIVGPLVREIPSIILAPLSHCVTTLAYFDTRVRKEGFDLQTLAKQLDQPTPESQPTPSVP